VAHLTFPSRVDATGAGAARLASSRSVDDPRARRRAGDRATRADATGARRAPRRLRAGRRSHAVRHGRLPPRPSREDQGGADRLGRGRGEDREGVPHHAGRGRGGRRGLYIRSGFRSHEIQQWLYQAYKEGYGNKAARPGFSNHQSGSALDIYLPDPATYDWLNKHARKFGFKRTVKGEPWHWEYTKPPKKKSRRGKHR
jgi:hypothetical protein